MNTERENAYYTVEATFIVTICVVIIMGVLYTGLYVHDRMIVESITASHATRWVHMRPDERTSDEEMQMELMTDLHNKLFLFTVCDISVSEGLTSKEVCVRYSLPVSMSFLKKAWGSDKEESIEVADIWPAKYKWDADAIKQIKPGKE